MYRLERLDLHAFLGPMKHFVQHKETAKIYNICSTMFIVRMHIDHLLTWSKDRITTQFSVSMQLRWDVKQLCFQCICDLIQDNNLHTYRVLLSQVTLFLGWLKLTSMWWLQVTLLLTSHHHWSPVHYTVGFIYIYSKIMVQQLYVMAQSTQGKHNGTLRLMLDSLPSLCLIGRL